MQLRAKASVSLSAVTFFFFILIGTMGWVVALTQLQNQQEGITRSLIEVGEEVLKVVVIAAAAAIAVERFLKGSGPPEDDLLRKVGIKGIFPRRHAAGEEFLRSVQDGNIRRITICGISLRDFLSGGGVLHETWREIRERLSREQTSDLPAEQRLHVRLLLLLPNSDEGYFRHAVESRSQTGLGGLPADIQNAQVSVEGAQQDIFGSPDAPFLQLRFYEHCPFSFVFATETQVFVEQYDYRDQSQPAGMPLINYQSGTNQYKEQMFSLDTIWKNARRTKPSDEVGTAPAIRDARIRNIYLGKDRDKDKLTKNQVTAIRRAREGSIDILAISGTFYRSYPSMAIELRRISTPKDDYPGIPIRFAIINPVSQQAIIRAVAESCPPEQVGQELRQWDWARHQQSNLYRDTLRTANILSTWSAQGCKISVQVYSSSVACAILRTDCQAFVEQYMYGRSKDFEPGYNLGGEYPVIEYELSKTKTGETVEQEVVEASFEMIWRFFSVSWKNFLNCDYEGLFEQNLARLRAEYGLLHSAGNGSASTAEHRREAV